MDSEPAYELARLSRRKLAYACDDVARGRDCVELRRVVLIQNSMQHAVAALSRPASPPRPVSPPPAFTPKNEPHYTPCFGLEELQAEERWFDAVLCELEDDMDMDDDEPHAISIIAVRDADGDTDCSMSDADSDGFPSLDDFFLNASFEPPPPPYTSATLDQHKQFSAAYDESYPPPLPDSFAADGWDDFEDGSEKLSIATLFEFDFSSEKSLVTEHHPSSPVLCPPTASIPTGLGCYPPSPYGYLWSSPYDAVVY